MNFGFCCKETEIGSEGSIDCHREEEVGLIAENDPGHDSGTRFPFQGKGKIERCDDNDPMLDKEAPEHRGGEVPTEIGENEPLNGPDKPPAIGEFAKKGLFCEDAETGGEGRDVAKVKWKEVVKRDLEIQSHQSELIDWKDGKANEGEEGPGPGGTAPSGGNADQGDRGQGDDGQAVRGAKKAHERVLACISLEVNLFQRWSIPDENKGNRL